jgi:ribosomal protein S12 methylthiotransferase
MRLQSRISQGLNKKMIGKTLEILIERSSRGGVSGRSYMDAPEIDGAVSIQTKKFISPGEFVKVRIKGAKPYDLIGEFT